jgi:hypothetical protein
MDSKTLKLVVRRQKASVSQEKRVAKQMAGRRVAGSGSMPGNKGDVRADGWLVEAKMTKGVRFTITLALWRKIYGEAVMAGRLPVMQLELAGRTVAVIDWQDFLRLRDAV